MRLGIFQVGRFYLQVQRLKRPVGHWVSAHVTRCRKGYVACIVIRLFQLDIEPNHNSDTTRKNHTMFRPGCQKLLPVQCRSKRTAFVVLLSLIALRIDFS